MTLGNYSVRHPVFPKRKPTFSVSLGQSWPTEFHYVQLVVSKATLVVPILKVGRRKTGSPEP